MIRSWPYNLDPFSLSITAGSCSSLVIFFHVFVLYFLLDLFHTSFSVHFIYREVFFLFLLSLLFLSFVLLIFYMTFVACSWNFSIIHWNSVYFNLSSSSVFPGFRVCRDVSFRLGDGQFTAPCLPRSHFYNWMANKQKADRRTGLL
jgi:hypothetical protein